jgi:hypothetical protein
MRRTNEAVAVVVNSNGSSAIMSVAYRECMKNQAIKGMPLTDAGNLCKGEMKGTMFTYAKHVAAIYRCFHRRDIHIEVVCQCHNHMVL